MYSSKHWSIGSGGYHPVMGYSSLCNFLHVNRLTLFSRFFNKKQSICYKKAGTCKNIFNVLTDAVKLGIKPKEDIKNICNHIYLSFDLHLFRQSLLAEQCCVRLLHALRYFYRHIVSNALECICGNALSS